MAGKFSGDVGAGLLVLNHISSKSDRSDGSGRSNQLRLIKDAKRSSEGKSEVIVAHDFMEILIPTGGFEDDNLGNKEKSRSPHQSKNDCGGDDAETKTPVSAWFKTE